MESPLYAAVTDPEPAAVPVNTTEQLVTPEVVDKLQVLELRLPPVEPGVSEKVTVPVGALEGVVVSATVAVTEALQLLVPRAMLQLTFPTLVDVLSLTVTVTLTVVGVVVAPSGEPVTVKLYEPAATEAPTLIVKTLVAPAKVGVTGLTVKAPQVTPAGRPEQDKVTGCAVPAFRVAVIVTVPPPPALALRGPLFDNE